MLKLAEGHTHQLGNPSDAVDQRHPLGYSGIVLDCLEVRVDVHPVERLSSRQAENRYRVREGLCDTAEGVLRSGSGLHGKHADGFAVLDSAEAVGHVHACALLAGENRPDALPRTRIDKRLCGECSDPLHALFLEDLCYCLVSVHVLFSYFSLVACIGWLLIVGIAI